MIRVKRISKIYRRGDLDIAALEETSFEVPEQSIIGVFGKSGSGKSTLIRSLGLIDKPTTGEIWLGRQEVTALPERERSQMRLRDTSFILQDFGLLPELTAEENVALPAMMLGISGYKNRVKELLDLVGLSSRLAHRPNELSFGQQQRVAVARALVTSPRYIFADEPTANLDEASSRDIMDMLERLNREFGVTVVYTTNSQDEEKYAEVALVMENSKLISQTAGAAFKAIA